MIKKTTEIDAILLDLNKAIDAHYQWLVNMFHSVVARDASKPEITDNHSHGLCQFGQWIEHLGPLDNDELPYVRLMNSAHQHMHDCGRELMLAIIENRWQEAHFAKFQEGLLSFTATLTDYKIYLLTIRSNMDVLTGLPGRRVLDESFCQLVDNHAIAHPGGHINITVTAGVSRAFPEEPLDVVIGRADRAMYEGKQTGRNRCMFINKQDVISRV
ncbi:CZB domain-containing protein [Escherichia albertii]|uniref:CZB domain-containing protein n=1 Tax=Escherichia albertii TaxID=208962 RepID=UPI000743DF0C|nr:CZB domain-containing protein [Escherichia albertii]